MNSALVHEKEQVFEIEELKMRLADRKKKVIVETDEVVRIQRKIKANKLNLEDSRAVVHYAIRWVARNDDA